MQRAGTMAGDRKRGLDCCKLTAFGQKTLPSVDKAATPITVDKACLKANGGQLRLSGGDACVAKA